MRRYVEWRILVREHGYDAIREEGGKIHRIGGAPERRQAEAIVRSDRIRVLHDPLAIEVRGPQYKDGRRC